MIPRRTWPDLDAPPPPLEKGHAEGEPVSLRVAWSRRLRGATGRPRLIWDRDPRKPAAIVLFLHGGAARSHLPVSEVMPGFLRVSEIAQRFRLAVRGPVGIVRLRFAILGWNEDKMSPVRDAQWALEQIRERHPGVPVAVVGHSMGGRTMIALSNEPEVVALVGLAPWIEPGDPEPENPDQSVLMLHGDLDVITSLRQTRALVTSLQDKGFHASLGRINRSGHGMMARYWVWSEATTVFLVEAINRHTGSQLHARRAVHDQRRATTISALAAGSVIADL